MKATSCVTHSGHAAPAGLPARHLPPCPGTVHYGRLQLAKSMARCNALATAKPRLLRSLAAAAIAHLDEFVEDPPTGLEILTSACDLADMQLVKFAHDLGVGLADLYMEALGFAWRDNGKTVLAAGGPVPDFVYDDGSGAADVVAVEAKGSASPHATPAAINTTALHGYQNQVAPSLGKTLAGRLPTGAIVGAGYAIGAAAPAGGGAATLAIHQTAFGAPTTAPPRGLPTVNTVVALGNYRAVFALAGADDLVAAVDVHRQVRGIDGLDPAGWTQFSTYRGRRLFVHQGGEATAELTGVRFAVDGEILESLFGLLGSGRPLFEPFVTIPQMPDEVLAGEGGGVSVSRDGLCAVLSDAAKPGALATGRRWRFGEGLQPAEDFARASEVLEAGPAILADI